MFRSKFWHSGAEHLKRAATFYPSQTFLHRLRKGPRGSECAHSELRGPGQTERTHSRRHDVALTTIFDGRRATVKARHTGLRHLQHGRWCACVCVCVWFRCVFALWCTALLPTSQIQCMLQVNMRPTTQMALCHNGSISVRIFI